MELQEQGGIGPFSQLSGTIPRGCCCILRVGSFGALPQGGHWKTHVRVELLGSAPTDAPEACAGWMCNFLFSVLLRAVAEGDSLWPLLSLPVAEME